MFWIFLPANFPCHVLKNIHNVNNIAKVIACVSHGTHSPALSSMYSHCEYNILTTYMIECTILHCYNCRVCVAGGGRVPGASAQRDGLPVRGGQAGAARRVPLLAASPPQSLVPPWRRDREAAARAVVHWRRAGAEASSWCALLWCLTVWR